MRTHTVFTLLDNSKHDTIAAAKDYCQEQMGAELRTLIVETKDASYYKQVLAIVVQKKYDREILSYVSWRQELDELEAYEASQDSITYS